MKKRYDFQYRGLKNAQNSIVREMYSGRWQSYGGLMVCPLRVKELMRDFQRTYQPDYEFRVRLVMVDGKTLEPVGNPEVVDVETI